jgi:hypothetical protein
MKKIISEISQEERNRILEMHKKAIINQHLVSEEMEPTTPEPKVGGGPLTGKLVSQLGEKTVSWGDTIVFDFGDQKNSGQGPLTINKFMGSSDNMMVDTKVPFTLRPGETFPLQVKVKLVEGGTTTRPDANGVINYDVPVYVFTDGKKPRYQYQCRATLYLQ